MIEVYSQPDLNAKGSISICNGTVLVPSLSGQSHFGYYTDFSSRRKVIHAVLTSNMLRRFPDLRTYLDENGQLLFYKPGLPAIVDVDDLLDHYRQLLNVLNKEFCYLKRLVARDLTLSLKLYAHFGAVAEYHCGNYSKVFGEAVAEATELRNNSIDSKSFVMLTDAFVSACSKSPCKEGKGFQASNICHVYGETRNIGFIYYDYEI